MNSYIFMSRPNVLVNKPHVVDPLHYRNLSPSLKSWEIQILHKAALEEVFSGMLSLGQRYQKSSKEAYLQLLREGHLILKGALLLSMDAAQG